MKLKLLDRSQETAYVYGYYDDASKEFLYVGQTLMPYRRNHSHTCGPNSKPEFLSPSVRFVILRKMTSENVSQIEAQIINKLKFMGQCRLNRRFESPNGGVRRSITNPIECSNGMVFIGFSQAARFFGTCISCIRTVLKYDGIITGTDNKKYMIWHKGKKNKPKSSLDIEIQDCMETLRYLREQKKATKAIATKLAI